VARFFLDTNVFLYAVGGEGPHRAACRALLAAVGDGELDGVTSSEVLQEILHVRSRRLGWSDATATVRAAAALVADVLPVSHYDVLAACDLIDRHPNLGARDSLHVAVMRSADIDTIISMDADFDAVPNLRRIHPDEVRPTRP
jgi:predicted nucleic acid-binding protein